MPERRGAGRARVEERHRERDDDDVAHLARGVRHHAGEDDDQGDAQTSRGAASTMERMAHARGRPDFSRHAHRRGAPRGRCPAAQSPGEVAHALAHPAHALGRDRCCEQSIETSDQRASPPAPHPRLAGPKTPGRGSSADQRTHSEAPPAASAKSARCGSRRRRRGRRESKRSHRMGQHGCLNTSTAASESARSETPPAPSRALGPSRSARWNCAARFPLGSAEFSIGARRRWTTPITRGPKGGARSRRRRASMLALANAASLLRAPVRCRHTVGSPKLRDVCRPSSLEAVAGLRASSRRYEP